MRLILIASGWVLGISLGRHLPTINPIFWLLFAAAVLGFSLLYRHRRYRWFAFALVALCLGGWRQAVLPQSSEVARFNGMTGTLAGIVVEEPVLRDESIQLRVEAEEFFANSETVAISGLLLVESHDIERPAYGDRVRATGLLSTPATWDTFSYADYLGRQGVFSIMQNAAVQVVSSGHGSPFHATLLRLKQVIQDQIERALPDPQAALLAGIVLGNEQGIAPALGEDFRRVGASHVIAISGFNMVVISAMVMRVAGALLGERKALATSVAVIFILMYSILVGASGGILRAALMSSLLVIGEQLRRRTFVPTSLAFATLLLSLLDPNVLLDIGFQLSFCAVLGLGLFAEPMSARFRRGLNALLPPSTASALHGLLNEPLIVSLAAQISTLPLIVLYFGRLSLVALPVNLLIVPAQSAILILAMVAAALSLAWPALGTLLYWADMVFLSWSIAIVRVFARLDFADIAISLDGRLIQFYYLVLIGGAMINAARPPIWARILKLLTQRRLLVSAVSAGGLTLVLMVAMAFSRSDGKLHVWLLDVGHTNAVLLQSPGGTQMLIDGGRFPSRLLTSIGDRLPFYDREIEVLAITHPDSWDISALNSVLDRYSVGVALWNGQPNRTDVVEEITGRLQTAEIAQVAVRAGYQLDFGDGVTVEVLHPQFPPRITDPLNDHVVVMRVSFRDVSILLTSDLSRNGQQMMLENESWPLANIIQISDHGSTRAFNADFLEAAQPQIALLQSDIANRRGDPAPDTIEIYNSVLDEDRLFRTDEIGTIHVSTDGQTVEVVGE